MEGETQMTEHSRKLGAAGLSYGTPAAEEMIRDRTRKLEGKGYPDARSAAIGQLAAEGNLKTEGEAITRSVSLAEAARKESVEDRQARIWLDRAKEEAAERRVSLSEIMNEKVMKGEVKL
jgi:DNA-binding protein